MRSAIFKPSSSIRRVAAAVKRRLFRRGQAGDAKVIDVPQASVAETSLHSLELRDWRKHFSDQLSGKGLEIGPLHRPMVRHDGMQITYIDRLSVEELRKHYPELSDLPLVEPDIIGDAETMEGVADNSYDFLISAHVIEHTRDPVGAIEQWCRIVRPGGLIYLVVPDKRYTFDECRVRTTLEHLILDYRRPSPERDYEHYLDYAIHVLSKRDSAAMTSADVLKDTDYSIHFHVFQPGDIVQLLSWVDAHVAGLEILEGPAKSPGSEEFHLLLRTSQP